MNRDTLSERGWEQLRTFVSSGPDKVSGEGSSLDDYERLRQRLISFFRWRGCISPDEYTDATFDRVARTLLEGTIVRDQDPAKYLLGVARLIFLERTKSEIRQSAAEKSVAEKTELSEEIRDRDDRELRLRASEECMQLLKTADKELILRYHRGEGAKIVERKTLAQQQGIPLNTLRIRMFRERTKLAECVEGKIS